MIVVLESDARQYVSTAESPLLREWCMRVMHESTWVVQRVRYYVSGAWEWWTKVVHESTWVVHKSSWVVHAITWVSEWCTWKTLVDWTWVLQGKLQSTGHGFSRANISRLGMSAPGQTLNDWAWNLQGKEAVDWAWDLQDKLFFRLGMGPAGQTFSRLCMGPPGEALLLSKARTSSRQWWSEDWRGGAVVDAGAEVTYCPIWLKWAYLYTQVQALHSTDTKQIKERCKCMFNKI